MKKKWGKCFLDSLFLAPLLTIMLLVAAPVMAGVTYNYTGNDYNVFSNSPADSSLGAQLTASFTFDSNVVNDTYTGYEYFHATSSSFNDITSWSVTSGSITLSSAAGDTEAGAMFHFTSGAIDSWYFDVGKNPGYYLMSYNSPGSGASIFDMGNNYYINQTNRTWNAVYNNPGTWAKEDAPIATPEPATMLLLSLGLIGVAVVKRKIID